MALRESLEAFEQARSAIDDLNSAVRRLPAEALTAMPRTAVRAADDPFARFEADKRAVAELWHVATEVSEDLQFNGISTDTDAVARLGSVAGQASSRLQLLDTTMELDLLLQWTRTNAPEIEEQGDGLAAANVAMRRLAFGLRRELDRLSGHKGPDPRLSLPHLVAKLCGLWERETGSPVTVNPYKKTEYTSVSPAGAFVCRVVETLKPTPSKLSDRMNPSGRSSAPHLKSQLDWSPRAIHSAMRLYLKSRNSEAEPRNPRHKHTL